ncbi:hypothetical protein E3T55_05465 [Cryobacterium frigoriphilum]|uniref:Bacterial Ig-like domain-containing protein n=1 Tax=Cryobacterium frigoriphilum TaxID=1259150 RepID=A0A4R9A7G6_9MICO|nr:hypothetical protein [Cryobacterium frigoriphilum]TFD53461.1 hypothetical protein E3T55_05465 [Cryobacterium frigoriphilum]
MKRPLRILVGSAAVLALALVLVPAAVSATAGTAVSSATPSSRPISVTVEITAAPTPSASATSTSSPAATAAALSDGSLTTTGTGQQSPATSTDVATETGIDAAVVRPVNASPTEDAVALTLDTNRVAPGGTITVSAGGYTAGEEIRVVLYSEPVVLGSATADAAGAFTATFTLPADLRTGTHTIEATGLTSGVVTNATVIVVGTAGASGGSLASTGQLWWIALGVGALGMIGVFLIGGFRGWWFTAWGTRRSLDGLQA